MKQHRLIEMVKAFREGAAERNSTFIGKNQQILIEGVSVVNLFTYSIGTFMYFINIFSLVKDQIAIGTVEMMPTLKLLFHH